jgi:formiminotetrahydrofolate cyclodeaminase/Zn-dependent peptidase ImmA (M78 family)
MDRKLIDVPLGELLNKFGAGSHKPGSGSAAALSAMVSAKMVITVIDLTTEKGAYAEYLPDLLKISDLIETDYYPELVDLFQRDSDEFDKVIKLRRQRNAEMNQAAKKLIITELEKAMRTATEIPMRIAELSLDIGKFAIEVFDHGFKAVRGDSGVGLNSAMSAVSGCLYIIDLNLASISPGEWMEDITWRKSEVMKQYLALMDQDAERHKVLEIEFELHMTSEFNKAMRTYQEGNLIEKVGNEEDLEKLVRNLQNEMWIHRKRIWIEKLPEEHIFSLQPEIVLEKILGYKYAEMDELGQNETPDGKYEVAGIIDKSKKLVQVSRKFSEESMRFTAAHELGHALLHNHVILHRDRAIDGEKNSHRIGEEMQADKFAVFFLMPAKYVREMFQIAFQTPKFEINDTNALAFGVGSLREFTNRYGDTRSLARHLASAKVFGGKAIIPMHKIFAVSVETMAIRLEELGLVKV